MEISASAPTRSRAINDILVNVPQPYVEGQTITAGEAAALNQTLAENVSNNLRQKFKDGVTEGDTTRPLTDAEAQALVDEYLAAYEMGVRQVGTGSSRVVDPIEREARKLAKAKARELVKNKGLKVKDVNLAEIADAIYDANVETLTAAGKKLVAAQAKAADTTGELSMEGLGL